MQPDVLTEYDHQVRIFLWAEFNSKRYPELKLLKGSLNGVKLSIGQAVKAKKIGANKKGFPDIFLPVPSQGYHGLFIELKPKTRGIKRIIKPKPDKDQIWWLQELKEQGYFTCYCHGHEEAILIIHQYLQGNL